MVIGIGSTSEAVNSTVIGNNNTLTGGKRDSDGVRRNNSIVVGESLEVEGTHNAVFGTDYMNWDRKLTKVAGEQNTVIGVGNLVGYTAEKDLSD
ncbi:MAG: Surface protein, partial [Negativicoccus succinicivorans DORA_17_25]